MSLIASYHELRTIGAQFSVQNPLFETRRRNNDACNTFLSHSNKDTEILSGVIALLESHGARVYIDDIDQTLPEPPSRITAEILKKRIQVCRRLVVLVTKNSNSSRWIPWELGLGDGTKSESSIAIFPAAESHDDSKWTELEYLGLYRKIVWGTFNGNSKGEWVVKHQTENHAIRLMDWLKGS